jgi:GNAT superfamily N-acetyltransferase
MALGLFDRYGRLRPEFLEHPFKKGSGIWGDELSSGNLLLLDEVTVNEAYRRQGLATKLVEAVIQASRERSNGFFALVNPGALSAEANIQTARLHERANLDTAAEREAFNDLVQDININLEVTATRFWRSVGFRRVGSSSGFALAGDASHPAHNLPAEKDFELPDVAQRGTLATLLVQNRTQNAQATNRDTLLTRLSRFLDGLSIQDARWHSTNKKGETVLHLAARGQDASAIAWILERNPRLSECRNLEGETPLDALLAALERWRTHHGQICVSDQFKGHSLKAVECLAILQNIKPTPAQDLRMKYECTCAHCICGYLSPGLSLLSHYTHTYI